MEKINKLLSIKYPIIQGGMANISTGEFAAAVSEAGGLGLIGSGGMTPEMLRENIRECRAKTNKNFGVNLMLLHPEIDELAQIVVDEKIRVVTTGAGVPRKYMPMWKKNGIIVMPVISSPSLAKKLEQLGADAIIAEGTESGGHIGEMTTMTLVPQVVNNVNIPVIAAGGISNGHQLAAAFALGASGVQVGTCLLVSEECPIHENYKNAIIISKGTDTTVTGRMSGVPVRLLKNDMSRAYIQFEKAGKDKIELEKYTLGSLKKAVFEGDIKNGSLMAGQVSGALTEIQPIKNIFENMYDEYKKTIMSLE